MGNVFKRSEKKIEIEYIIVDGSYLKTDRKKFISKCNSCEWVAISKTYNKHYLFL